MRAYKFMEMLDSKHQMLPVTSMDSLSGKKEPGIIYGARLGQWSG